MKNKLCTTLAFILCTTLYANQPIPSNITPPATLKSMVQGLNNPRVTLFSDGDKTVEAWAAETGPFGTLWRTNWNSYNDVTSLLRGGGQMCVDGLWQAAKPYVFVGMGIFVGFCILYYYVYHRPMLNGQREMIKRLDNIDETLKKLKKQEE